MVVKSPYPDLVIPEVAVHEYILERMKEFGDSKAMVQVDNTRKCSITFREVREQVIKCASALYKRGLRKGEVVAICAANRLEYGVILLAVSACGGISTTCNPRYKHRELLQQFTMSKPCMVFCEADIFPMMEMISAELPTLREIFTFGEIVGKFITTYNMLVDQNDGQDFPTTIKVDAKEDVFILPYSSGTTGLPKGVMLTHYNIIYQIVSSLVGLFQGRSSIFYLVTPMFTAYGFRMTLNHFAVGALNVFESRFDMERLLQAVQEHKISVISAVPPIMLQLAQTKLLWKYDVSSLRQVTVGAAPTAQVLIDDVTRMYGVDVVPSYGLTEMSALAMSNPLGKKNMTVGVISTNTTIKIVDPLNGNELGPYEDGEILAKGPQMMKGYLGNPEATAKTIDSDGWFHTGDIGHYDDDGMLYIVDRLKEMIKYKGFQIAPTELEALLLTHPDILDVAIIGYPDQEAGELPKAFVVRKRSSLTENTVKKFVEGQVSNYKRLRGGVQFISMIPKSASGKILRRDLRKLHLTTSNL